MKLALFGRGEMGRVVAERARQAGHEIGAVFSSADAGGTGEQLVRLLRGHDAAIDFSAADAVLSHATACAAADVPLVEGTTGWRERETSVRSAVQTAGGALVYGANFSIGANLFYRLVTHAEHLFRAFTDYDAFIEEAHHAAKRDAPSGTALRLRDILARPSGRAVTVASTRAGHIPGTHRVGFDAPDDQITLEHTARSRNGFAAGALVAVAWIIGRRGVFTFDEVVDDMLGSAGH
jgi:4-hydroxy-tetrahydrodipicolinate reductase